jgi:hypothetical protein
MSAELRRLQEQGDAFVALAEALRTPDGWLSYRAEALRDQLQECEREAPARPSSLERICTALIERDEALQQARRGPGDDVHPGDQLGGGGGRRPQRQPGAPFVAPGGQAQQSQDEERAHAAEQKAKEANELKATLDAKAAALATAEDQLLQERTARQGAEGQL